MKKRTITIIIAILSIFILSCGGGGGGSGDSAGIGDTSATGASAGAGDTSDPVRADVLLLSTSKLATDAAFDTVVSDYTALMEAREGLKVLHVVTDSERCYELFGVSASHEDGWQAIKALIRTLLDATGARYIILLGGEKSFPRPVVTLEVTGETYPSVDVSSDAWYIDFDNNKIVDADLYISRIPDLNYSTGIIKQYLRHAMVVHGWGGIHLANRTDFDSSTSPPYGTCDTCDAAVFYTMMGTFESIFFWGHGAYVALRNYEHVKILNYNEIRNIDFSGNHPMVFALNPCRAGMLSPDSHEWPSLSTEFIENGASGYFANTAAYGFTALMSDFLYENMTHEYTIGKIVFDAMRMSLEEWPDYFDISGAYVSVNQFNLYGDPTIRNIVE